MQRFAARVCLIGRADQLLAKIHPELASSLVLSGKAVFKDWQKIQIAFDLENEPLAPSRPLTRAKSGSRYVRHEPVFGGTRSHRVCAGEGCDICDGAGTVPAISGHVMAFNQIDEQDKHLFQLAVTDCLVA